jgi:GNAT superfamily N-acetyltransferase
MSTDLEIRYATEADIDEILNMINELASFENESSAVQATKDSLTKTLSFPISSASTTEFTPGFARCFMLVDPSKQIAGFALFFTNYSTWRGAPGVYLEDLFVRPAFRRLGYAKRLLNALAQETIRIGGKRLEWACLKWNENALAFYNSLGAKRMDEWVGLRVDGDALIQLADGRPNA